MLTKNIIDHGKSKTKNIPIPNKQSLVLGDQWRTVTKPN